MPSNPEKIYVDTSAFYALLDRADPYHKEASSLWVTLMDNNSTLVTSNYVVSETVKLLQKRQSCGRMCLHSPVLKMHYVH